MWRGRNGKTEGKGAVGGLGEGQLCRLPDVSMRQATDFTDWHDLPSLRRLDRPRVRRILAEGEMGSGAMVHEVASQDVAQVALAQDEDVVETLAPDRADDALRDGVLVGPAGGRENFLDLHPFTRWRNASP